MATNHFTHASVLALNAVLVESPESLTTGAFAEITSSIIVQGIASSQPFIADNCVLAAGKYLLTESSDKSFDSNLGEVAAFAVESDARPIEDVHIDHDPGRPVGLTELLVLEDEAEHLLGALESRGWTTHR